MRNINYVGSNYLSDQQKTGQNSKCQLALRNINYVQFYMTSYQNWLAVHISKNKNKLVSKSVPCNVTSLLACLFCKCPNHQNDMAVPDGISIDIGNLLFVDFMTQCSMKCYLALLEWNRIDAAHFNNESDLDRENCSLCCFLCTLACSTATEKLNALITLLFVRGGFQRSTFFKSCDSNSPYFLSCVPGIILNLTWQTHLDCSE